MLDNFWGHGSNSIVFSLESLSSCFGCSVNSEGNLLVLASMSERVKSFVSIIKVTSVSMPPWLWDLIVEESRRHALSKLFESEPFDYVWFLSLTKELHRGPLRVELVHGVVPSLS